MGARGRPFLVVAFRGFVAGCGDGAGAALFAVDVATGDRVVVSR